MFSPLAKALYIGVRVDVDVTAPTFYHMHKKNLNKWFVIHKEKTMKMVEL